MNKTTKFYSSRNSNYKKPQGFTPPEILIVKNIKVLLLRKFRKDKPQGFPSSRISEKGERARLFFSHQFYMRNHNAVLFRNGNSIVFQLNLFAYFGYSSQLLDK